MPVGCGSARYAVEANSADRQLREARALGAEHYAPYEYFYAREHLDKARTEAAEADYGDAIGLAKTSEEYAVKAAQLARGARRKVGR